MADREKGGFWVGFTATCFYPLSRVARCEYRHPERVPRTGGALLVLNHVSHFDPITDAVLVHRQRRVPRFMAKDTLFKVPVLGRILVSSGGIPVYRRRSNAGESLREAHRTLREGKIVVIYPEGTITRDPDGWMKNSYTGVARLALENDVPVIPVARWGTNLVLDGYRKKFRPLPRKTVVFNIGEPVDLTRYRELPVTSASLREVTDLLTGEITKLLADIRGEQPPSKEPGSRVSDV
ncbi:MAG: 1-acyl-sn-glycerol-3-phosphate acyltransferase [Actinophytocola sp.]|nr:1-acyl-sn-glycerol-3-phosphate acyltransferase [Actinophytocola sp.]